MLWRCLAEIIDTQRTGNNSTSLDSSMILRHFFFFNDTATTEIYTLSLHDALPIQGPLVLQNRIERGQRKAPDTRFADRLGLRSEEHTSELQSQFHIVCRLLLE